jgi:hypothetical protein
MKSQLSKNPAGEEPRETVKPSPEEIAGKAYFMYVHEGFPDGRDMEHWLDAEKQLITGSLRTRIHGSHN